MFFMTDRVGKKKKRGELPSYYQGETEEVRSAAGRRKG